MAERNDRHVDSDETPELRRVHAGGGDDDLALDASLVGLDCGHASLLGLDAGDPGADLDPCAQASRGVSERERQLAGIEVAVVGYERRRANAVGAHRREELLRVRRRDDLHRQAERLRPGGLAADLLEPRLRRREPQAAELVPAGIVPRQLLELRVEADRVLHHPCQRDRRAELPDEPGRVPGRAVGELVLLEQHGVRPPELSEVVQGRAADHAAADHHGAGPSGEHGPDYTTSARFGLVQITPYRRAHAPRRSRDIHATGPGPRLWNPLRWPKAGARPCLERLTTS